jgi:hypothetical protein
MKAKVLQDEFALGGIPALLLRYTGIDHSNLQTAVCNRLHSIDSNSALAVVAMTA